MSWLYIYYIGRSGKKKAKFSWHETVWKLLMIGLFLLFHSWRLLLFPCNFLLAFWKFEFWSCSLIVRSCFHCLSMSHRSTLDTRCILDIHTCMWSSILIDLFELVQYLHYYIGMSSKHLKIWISVYFINTSHHL